MPTGKALEFCVAGRPVGKERPRVTKFGTTYTPKRTVRFEAQVRQAALLAKIRKLRDGVGMPKSPYKVEIRIMWQDKRHPDIDNVAKAILDGMNKVAYDDDAEVTQLDVAVLGTDKHGAGVGVRIMEAS